MLRVAHALDDRVFPVTRVLTPDVARATDALGEQSAFSQVSVMLPGKSSTESGKSAKWPIGGFGVRIDAELTPLSSVGNIIIVYLT